MATKATKRKTRSPQPKQQKPTVEVDLHMIPPLRPANRERAAEWLRRDLPSYAQILEALPRSTDGNTIYRITSDLGYMSKACAEILEGKSSVRFMRYVHNDRPDEVANALRIIRDTLRSEPDFLEHVLYGLGQLAEGAIGKVRDIEQAHLQMFKEIQDLKKELQAVREERDKLQERRESLHERLRSNAESIVNMFEQEDGWDRADAEWVAKEKVASPLGRLAGSP